MTMFSVIIPCWNASATLAETLNSVRAQSFTDFQVIIVDDGSTDSSVSIASQFAAMDPRFSCVVQDNAGPSAARNNGVFKYASGEYIAFLDADDIWAPAKLELCAAALGNSNAPDALYGRIAFFRDNIKTVETRSTVAHRPLSPFDLLCENAVCTTSNVVVSREWFVRSGGFNRDVVHCEDVEWLIRIAAQGARIESIDEVLVYYRASDYGLSANLDAMQAAWKSLAELVIRLGHAPSASQLAGAEAIHLRYLARRALRVQASRGTALRIAAQAIARSPKGFFSNPRRGLMTLAAALCEAIAPQMTAALMPR